MLITYKKHQKIIENLKNELSKEYEEAINDLDLKIDELNSKLEISVDKLSKTKQAIDKKEELYHFKNQSIIIPTIVKFMKEKSHDKEADLLSKCNLEFEIIVSNIYLLSIQVNIHLYGDGETHELVTNDNNKNLLNNIFQCYFTQKTISERYLQMVIYEYKREHFLDYEKWIERSAFKNHVRKCLFSPAFSPINTNILFNIKPLKPEETEIITFLKK